MRLSGYIRNLKLSTDLENRIFDYQKDWNDISRLSLQLSKFNDCWQNILKTVPYYRSLSKENKIPSKFKSWEEFIEKVPVITKDTIQNHTNEMSNSSHKADFYRITGGTTSKPIQLPAWYSENKSTQFDMWMARKWYGINPSSRLFMIWGHSHLLGNGINGKINAITRKIKDRLANYKRFSAYDMNWTKMQQAARELIKFRPDYVIGYSVALDAFARANQELAVELRNLEIKVVIGAAEGFPNHDSEEIIEHIFNCPVAMEYGSVETGLIGHTLPDDGYMVFWQNYFVETVEEGENSSKILRITSLFNRCFPLIRYEIGDEVETYEGNGGIGLWRFRKVKGRCNLFILLQDGTKVHSEAFTHCVRDFAEISSYQVIQSKDKIKLLIVPKNGYSSQVESKIKSRLEMIHPELYRIHFKKVDKLRQTIAGKTPMILREY